MSEKGQNNRKATREARLAANLRANLRRRKQAARKVKTSSLDITPEGGQNLDKSSP